MICIVIRQHSLCYCNRTVEVADPDCKICEGSEHHLAGEESTMRTPGASVSIIFEVVISGSVRASACEGIMGATHDITWEKLSVHKHSGGHR